MATYFFDTSALAKRYVIEIGSTWVEGIVRPTSQHTVLVAAIVRVEMISLLARRRREGKLTPTQLTNIRRTFLTHLRRDYMIISIDDRLLARASILTDIHGLRALDALQLASALISKRTFRKPITFLSGDKQLLAAAQAEGFLTDDPNTHP